MLKPPLRVPRLSVYVGAYPVDRDTENSLDETPVSVYDSKTLTGVLCILRPAEGQQCTDPRRAIAQRRVSMGR